MTGRIVGHVYLLNNHTELTILFGPLTLISSSTFYENKWPAPFLTFQPSFSLQPFLFFQNETHPKLSHQNFSLIVLAPPRRHDRRQLSTHGLIFSLSRVAYGHTCVLKVSCYRLFTCLSFSLLSAQEKQMVMSRIPLHWAERINKSPLLKKKGKNENEFHQFL